MKRVVSPPPARDAVCLTRRTFFFAMERLKQMLHADAVGYQYMQGLEQASRQVYYLRIYIQHVYTLYVYMYIHMYAIRCPFVGMYARICLYVCMHACMLYMCTYRYWSVNQTNQSIYLAINPSILAFMGLKGWTCQISSKARYRIILPPVSTTEYCK